MILLRLFEFALIVVSLTVLITQVLVPAVKGTRLFPWFDKRRRAAIHDLVEANEAAEVESVERAAEAARQSNKENGDV